MTSLRTATYLVILDGDRETYRFRSAKHALEFAEFESCSYMIVRVYSAHQPEMIEIARDSIGTQRDQ